jgi:transcriptional regulator with XRE-family HTH domain
MSPQLRIRPGSADDDLDQGTPWSILPIADNLVERRQSTTTRLGMPYEVREIDDALNSLEEMTGSVASWGRHFWQTYLTSTETGIRYMAISRPVGEKVQRLRDEIARRTRLTRQQIARAVGVDRRSLSAWVRGDTTPSVEKLQRLQLLADIVRDIDAPEPGRSTEILLSRSGGEDLLDHLAAGRITAVRDWQAFRGSMPSVTIERRRPTKRPLHQNALNAYLRGELGPLGRAATVRPESDYEQDLSQAERLMRDEPVRRTRRGYR